MQPIHTAGIKMINGHCSVANGTSELTTQFINSLGLLLGCNTGISIALENKGTVEFIDTHGYHFPSQLKLYSKEKKSPQYITFNCYDEKEKQKFIELLSSYDLLPYSLTSNSFYI